MERLLVKPDSRLDATKDITPKGFRYVGGEKAAAMPHLSPSLIHPTRKAAAYEMKFLLPAEQAERVEKWAWHHLSPDPYAEEALNGAYRVQSVYFDTDAFDVYYQTAWYRRNKFRLRRYGEEENVYLERKSKSHSQVSKHRTLVRPEELDRLSQETLDEEWHGHWFHEKLLAQGLKPRSLVRYDRVAHIGVAGDSPIRLTMDRNIHAAPVEGYGFKTTEPELPLLTEEVILELKFRGSMPTLFKHLIQEERLNPNGVSKYRRGVQAWRLMESGGDRN
jgi:hypothetical protein